MSAHEISPITQRLAADTRRRLVGGSVARELAVEVVFGGAFLVGAYALATLAPGDASLSLGAALAFVAAYAVFAATMFPTGEGFAVPTQIVIVPLLLLAPSAAPLAIMLGMAVYKAALVVRGRLALSRVLLAAGDVWFAMGPALVLVLGARRRARTGTRGRSIWWPWQPSSRSTWAGRSLVRGPVEAPARATCCASTR